MKFTFTKRWCSLGAEIEGNTNVSAGSPLLYTDQSSESNANIENRIAFSHFLSLFRRQKSLSIEELAQKTDLDVDELLLIEHDPHVLIEPRTIYQLSHFFNVPNVSMMALAGFATDRGNKIPAGTVRAAAHSVSMAKLTDEEGELLGQLIQDLTKSAN